MLWPDETTIPNSEALSKPILSQTPSCSSSSSSYRGAAVAAVDKAREIDGEYALTARTAQAAQAGYESAVAFEKEHAVGERVAAAAQATAAKAKQLDEEYQLADKAGAAARAGGEATHGGRAAPRARGGRRRAPARGARRARGRGTPRRGSPAPGGGHRPLRACFAGVQTTSECFFRACR